MSANRLGDNSRDLGPNDWHIDMEIEAGATVLSCRRYTLLYCDLSVAATT
jgi:hypothetical protein